MTDQTKHADVNSGSLTARRLALELKDSKTRQRAVDEIALAFEKTEGNATKAAERLGVSHRGLMRWIKEVEQLERRVKAIRKKHDHPHEIGDKARQKS